MATTRADTSPTLGRLPSSSSGNPPNLLTIPFEVRNNILRHLLYRPEGISWHDQEDGIRYPDEPARCVKLSRLDLHPQSLRVNSQLRDEGSSVLNKGNAVVKHFYQFTSHFASASQSVAFVRRLLNGSAERIASGMRLQPGERESTRALEKVLIEHKESERKENIMKYRVSKAEAKIPNVVLTFYFGQTNFAKWLFSYRRWSRIAEIQGTGSKNLTIDIRVWGYEKATIDLNNVEVLHMLDYFSTLRELRYKSVKVLVNGVEVKPDWAQEMVGSAEASVQKDA